MLITGFSMVRLKEKARLAPLTILSRRAAAAP